MNPPAIPYRNEWTPAYYRGAPFYVDSGSKEGGRRIALHEFPKKELPYAEDMGRRAFRFSVRAYVMTYPPKAAARIASDNPTDTLHVFDYRDPRDLLQWKLDEGIPGPLIFLPTVRPIATMPKPIIVTCDHYRMTEEERFGGYCVFDIEFVEFGVPPNQTKAGSATTFVAAQNAVNMVQNLTVAGASGPAATDLVQQIMQQYPNLFPPQ